MNTKAKYTLLEAKTKLESFCAYQERCEQDITRKLSDWGIFGEDHDILIADLISNNYLNESRFAEAFVSGKFRIKHWGKTKITAHLKSKRISDYSIKKAIKLIEDEDYLSTLNQLAEKKWASLSRENHWDKIAKLKRYLYNKGYEAHYLNEITNQFIEQNESI